MWYTCSHLNGQFKEYAVNFISSSMNKYFTEITSYHLFINSLKLAKQMLKLVNLKKGFWQLQQELVDFMQIDER